MWRAPQLLFGAPAGDAPAPPAWADPRTLMALCAWKFTEVAVVGGVDTLVAPADPKRVALGLIGSETPAVNGKIRPQGVPTWAGWLLETPQNPYWFTVFDYGQLVNAGWMMQHFADGIIGVYEIYRLS